MTLTPKPGTGVALKAKVLGQEYKAPSTYQRKKPVSDALKAWDYNQKVAAFTEKELEKVEERKSKRVVKQANKAGRAMNTTTSRLTVALFIASLLLSANRAKAQTYVYSFLMDHCITDKVQEYTKNGDVISPRQLVAWCACVEKRVNQKLRAEDCPGISTVSIQQMKQYFTGDW